MAKKGADAAVRKLGRFWLIFLALAALLLVLAAACGGGEEEKGTPTATRTAAATATRTAAATATRTAAATATLTPTAIATPTATPTAIATMAPTVPPTAEATVTPAETSTPFFDDPVPGISDTEIVLGSHFAQTGTYGAAFAPVLAGMKAYFNYVNAEKGGVCGRQIVLKVEDDAYDPANSPAAVRKLVEQDEVFAIIAGLGTAAHSAVWEYLNKGIPDLWIMSGAHMWAATPEEHPWSVGFLPDYYVEGTIFGKYISTNLPNKNVGVLYQNDDYGKDELAGVKNGLDPTKNEVVSEQSYEPTAVDIRSLVTNLKDAGAEVVVGACIPGHCAQAIKAADQMGWHPQFLIGSVNSDEAMFTYAGGPEVMEGVISLQVNKMADWTDDPAVAKHHEIMEQYSTIVPGNFTIFGQETASLTVEALSRTCDNLTRQGLMDAVHSFQEYQPDLMLPGITITLSPTDHLAIEGMRMLVATVTPEGEGKWEYFGPIITFRD